MYNFNLRIKKLKEALGELPQKVKIIYSDGSEKIVYDGGDAINACLHKNAVKVQRIGEDDESGWIDVLQSLCDTDINELWEEHGDVPI